MRERRKKRLEMERELAKEKKRRKRKRTLQIQIGAVVLVFLAALYTAYDKIQDQNTMGCRLAVSGVGVSWMGVEEAAQKIQEKFQESILDFQEDGKSVYQVSLGEAGYSLDEAVLKASLEELKASRKPCLSLMEFPKNREIPYQLVEQQDKKAEALAAKHFEGEEKRVSSTDAAIAYNDGTGRYEIAAQTQGNQIDEGKLRQRVDETLQSVLAEDLVQKKIPITVDTGTYVEPVMNQNTPELEARRDELNARLDNYPKSSVTYTFGSVTEELDSETIQSWVIREDQDVYLNEEAVLEYVWQLGEKYNTLYVSRLFQTSYGEVIQIDQNEYGYQIDQEAEYQQLMEDIRSGTAVTREPVYAKEGLGREGDDDLLGSYVEISISQQYLWMYQNGALVTETPVVTGKPMGINTKTGQQEDWSTYYGAFPLAYKASPFVLSSDIYGYEVEVQYWMPFVEGQGLHDADWQPGFGGSIYLTNGSHGCVNLPVDQAAVIYNYIEAGYPIIIY